MGEERDIRGMEGTGSRVWLVWSRWGAGRVSVGGAGIKRQGQI